MTIPRIPSLVGEAQLPVFGDPATIFSIFILGAVLGGAYALARGFPYEKAKDSAFVGALLGGSAALIAYLVLLIEGLFCVQLVLLMTR